MGSCRCDVCGKPCDCGEGLCIIHMIEDAQRQHAKLMKEAEQLDDD